MTTRFGTLTSAGLAPACLALFGLTACTGGPGDTPVSEPSEVGQVIAQALEGQANIAPVQVALAELIFSLPTADAMVDVTSENCQLVEGALHQACALLGELGSESYCYAESTFFMAHSTPRCASRLHLTGETETIYAFDLSGQSLTGPVDTCGDGIVDEEEQCDDGNHEDWDGCTANCEIEEFQGCEAVIQQYYEDAGIALVDKNRWDGPRTHIMVNPSAKALTQINQLSCDAALAVGVDVCNELVNQMPFVSECKPMGGLRNAGQGDQCDLRFLVYFSQTDPDSGVFTTAMPGLLAFTLGQSGPQ